VISLWLWPFAGGFVGMVNALSRWKTVSCLSTEMVTRSLVLVVGGMLLRLGLVAGLLTAGLKRGIIPGLLAFAGLWITRWTIVVWFSTREGRRRQGLSR
jgi:hypothetical protein